MGKCVLYIHGKGGSPEECGHYRPLFPDHRVIGLDYATFTPWETGREILGAVEKIKKEYSGKTLVANSIGAFFTMNSGADRYIRKAYFISPVVDMERLILDMMAWAGVSEEELESKGTIPTPSGETLSWGYLRYVMEHPVSWNAPTEILYGSGDDLISQASVNRFAEEHHARLTVMEGGEHWFHTEEQMRFLDGWIREAEMRREP